MTSVVSDTEDQYYLPYSSNHSSNYRNLILWCHDKITGNKITVTKQPATKHPETK